MNRIIRIGVLLAVLFSVTVLADLPEADISIDQSVQVEPLNPQYNQKVTLSIMIENTGPDDITGPVKIIWKLNNRKLHETKIINLAAYDYKTISVDFRVKESEYTLSVERVSRAIPYQDNNSYNDSYSIQLSFPEVQKPANITTSQQTTQSTGLPGNTTTTPTNPGNLGKGSGSNNSDSGSGTNSETGSEDTGESTGTDNSGNLSRGGGTTTNSTMDATSAQVFSEYYLQYLKVSGELKVKISKETDAQTKASLEKLSDEVNELNARFTSLTKGNSVSGSSESETSIPELVDSIEEYFGNLDLMDDLGEPFITKSKKMIEVFKIE
ncbi:MAG: hypothetical protein JW737_05435 [Acidobacteria bacterium]|nr:hypothetical protein [Acidobacteriota bacterium]